MGNVASREQRILKKAKEIFGEKGFSETTISEISKSAGITESVVYDNFASKEEILFAIPEKAFISYLEDLEDHLEGIKGAENKLRKLIWYHCKYFSTQKDYTKVLALECRSNPRFYRSEAYKLIKAYGKVLENVFEEGKADGTFSSTVSPRLLRDMVMGTIDHIALNWIMRGTSEPLYYSEQIHNLIVKAASYKTSPMAKINHKTDRRRQIINAATRIFAENGYKEATISQIAKEAGVADGTIYEYFKSKEDLLISIPEEKLREFFINSGDSSPKIRLKRNISKYFRFFNEHRECTSIIVLLLRPNKKFYSSPSYEILDKIATDIKDIIVDGQGKGAFRQDIDKSVFQHLFFGTVDHIIIPWIMFKRKYDLIKIGDQATDLFINTIQL